MINNYIKSIATKLLNVVYGLAILKLLSVYLVDSDFSDYYLYFNACMYASSVFFGLQSAITLRFYPVLGNRKINLISNAIGKYSLYMLIGTSVVFLFLFDPKMVAIGVIIIFSLGSYNIQLVRLRIKLDFTKVFVLVFLQTSISIILLWVFKNQLNVNLSLLVLAISFFIPVILFKGFSLKKLFVKDSISLLSNNSNVLNYGFPVLLIGLSNSLMSSMDQYFLKTLGYSDDLPGYIANYNIAEKSVFVILSIITMVFVPKIFNKYKNLTKETFKDVLVVELYFITLSIIVIVFVACFSGSLTGILTDAKYNTHSWIIPYIAFGALILGVNSILSEILTVQYKTKIVLYCYLLGASCNFVLNCIFIERHGVSGAVLTTILSYLLTLIATVIFVIKEYNNLRLPS